MLNGVRNLSGIFPSREIMRQEQCRVGDALRIIVKREWIVERIGFWKDYRRNHFGKTKAYKINFFKMDICIPIHNLLIYYYLLFLK